MSWKSTKQSVVAQSTMQAEYVVTADAANEAVWLRKVVKQLGVFPSARDPVTVLYENTSAIANAKELRSHSTAKHILRRFHVIRDYVLKKRIKICKVHTDLNVIDPLAKALLREKHDQHEMSMGVRLLPDVN